MDDPRNIKELIMDNGLPTNKPVTLKDVEKINKEKHHKNMQNRIHRIDDSYQIPGEKPMSTADKPTSKFMDAMTQVLANEAEITEKKKVKLDPVGKEDDDVDNDGDSDSSDKYLHNRRKAIGKAIAKEEVEELDELKKSTLGSYVKKAADSLGRHAYKAGDVRDKDSFKNHMKSLQRQIGISTATDKLTKEEVEPLAELSKEKLKGYIKAAAGVEPVADRTQSLPTLAAATGRYSERSQMHKNKGDYSAAKLNSMVADKMVDKSQKRRKGIALAADKLAKEEVEVNEAATVLLRKGGATKRMRYNPESIERLKREGWVVASEAFVDKVRALFDIAEEITFEDALSLVEAVDEVKRGRGRPKKAVDPNAAPKREWKPGGRGRPPKNKDTVTKVSTSDTKSAGPADKADNDATDTGHILDHLRKAVSTNGTNSFRQKNGSTAKVSRDAALSLLSHHDKLPKASDRFQMQQHLSKSPEHLQNAIKNVAAGKPYNAGYENAKPKAISLAPKNWNDKK